MKKKMILSMKVDANKHDLFEEFVKDYGAKVVSQLKPRSLFVVECKFPDTDEYHYFIGTAVSKFKDVQIDVCKEELEEER